MSDRTDLGSAPTAVPDVVGGSVYATGDVIASRYEVRALLGQGGMGAVFRVHDRELDEEVALKVLHPAYSLDGRALERFRREVKLARRVTHPNVARTFDMGFERVRFLTMELVAGEAVSALVRDGARPPLPETLRIAEAVSRGLSAAHAAGVVHRDLKPDNVMRAGRGGRIVITDFGIARLAALPGNEDAMRRTGDQIAGTPAYMAPEQITSQPLDGRTDVYALGVMTFELLTGRLPFLRATLLASAAARLTEEPPDVRTFAPDVPAPVADLVKSMLARRREDRPDAESVLQALERLRGSRDDRRVTVAVGPTPTMSKRAQPVVAVSPLGEIGDAIADGLSEIRGTDVLAPTAVADAMRDGSTAIAAARTLGATMLVDGSVRTEGESRRARVRLLAAADGRQLWAASPIDGAVADGFAFEDRVTHAVVDAVRERVASTTRNAPDDPAARELYERARDTLKARTVPSLREGAALLEDGLRRFPRDPFIMSLLSASLIRLYGMTGARATDLALRGEELALRSLALDSSIGETYFAIGVLRYEQGESRASARALEEAIARAPALADAHAALGVVLADSGRPEDAMRRFDTSIALDPSQAHAWIERARLRAMLGDRPGAEDDLAHASAIAESAASMLLVRAVLWWRDRARAGEVADRLERAPTGAAWEKAAPFLRAYATGEKLPAMSARLDTIAGDASIAPRNLIRLIEISAEFLAEVGLDEEALAWLERAEALPFHNVLWMDRCPNLDGLRGNPRFARVRAKVAVRAAEIWR